MSRPALFLDRDGTLIEERGFIDRLDMVTMFPWTGDALRLIRRAGYAAVVVTNQSAIARGMIDEAFLDAVHRSIDAHITTAGGPYWWAHDLGGKGWSAPQLPTFHSGGIVPGPRGAEVLGVLQGGERVLPLGSEDGGGGVLVVGSDGSKLGDAIVEIIARAVRKRGPRAIGINLAPRGA